MSNYKIIKLDESILEDQFLDKMADDIINFIIQLDSEFYHPGSYIKDIIDDKNISKKQFAENIGISIDVIDKLVNGEISITDDIANKLADFTGVSTKTWMNLQRKFDKRLLEHKNLNKIEETFNV